MVRRCGMFGSMVSPLAITRLYRISADLLHRREGRREMGKKGKEMQERRGEERGWCISTWEAKRQAYRRLVSSTRSRLL